MKPWVHNILRYPRLYGAIIANNLAAEFSFPVDFWLTLVARIVWITITILFYGVIYSHTTAINGWTHYQSLLILATFQWLSMLLGAICGRNFARMPQYITHGDLDTVLLKPVDDQFLVSTRYLALPAVLNFLPVFGLGVYAWSQLGLPLSVSTLLGFLGLVAVSFLLLYSIWFISVVSLFWLGRIWEIHELFIAVFQGMSYPQTIYRGPVRLLLTFAIPILFTVTVPAEVLLGTVRWSQIAALGASAVVVTMIGRWVWHRGLRRYTSSS